MTKTTADPTALALPEVTAPLDPEAQKLTVLQSLEQRIAIAAQEAEELDFNYETKEGMAAARSHIAALRKYNGEIDRAHKEAKEIHLRRGQAVDAVKKLLKDKVSGLIQPHADAIQAIEEAEQKRIERLRYELEEMARLAAVETSQQAEANIEALKGLDPTKFDEFEQEACDLQQRVWSQLTQLHGRLHEREQKDAELLRLQEMERQTREQADAERLRQEGIAAERLRQERQREQEQQEQIRREQAQQRQIEEAKAARVAAEQRAEADRQRTLQLQEQQRQRKQEEERLRQLAAEKAAGLRSHLIDELSAAMATMAGPADVAQAIAQGTLHPAVKVDWASFSPDAWEGA